ncbi:MAG: CDP-alcohol phosphatidyltransferase family protein, partial [Tangfeifania sp.]
MRNIIRQIPNFITSLNLVSGSLAVFFAVDGHLIWAGIFICLAAVLDFLDGFAARLLNAYSDMGKQLDSLGDLVSFGLAPAAILFTLLEFSMFGKNQPIYEIAAHWSQWLILFSAFLMPVLGAVRLARFNNAPEEGFFRGLPIPSNGLFWASLGLMLEMPRYQQLFEMVYSTRTLLLLGLFTSGMMVINLPMFSLKFENLNWKENRHRFLFLAIALALLAIFNVYGLAL